jgi:hypothetical protein
MTTLSDKVKIFRAEVEDFYRKLTNIFYFNNGTPYNDEGAEFIDEGEPYESTEQVLEMIPLSMRKKYLPVNILGVEYWFLPDGSLVPKVASMAIADGSIVLVKLADMSSGTLYYRKSAGAGPPETQTLAQLRTDLNIPAAYTIPAGYSLITTEDLARIHDDHDDIQDLTDYALKTETDKYDYWRIKAVKEIESIEATPPTVAEILANKTYGGYSKSGAKVYKKEGDSYIPDTGEAVIDTNIVWDNAAQNLTDGVMNRCAVWSSLDAVNGQYIGFGREVVAPENKIYWVGVGADNYMSIEVNSEVVKTFPSGDTLNDHYESWHLIPVILNAGANLIHVRGYNDEGLAAIGVEIYDATLSQLRAMASVEALDAVTIFSTKSLIGSYVEEGNFGTGYTCAEGYSLINRDGVYSCDRVVFGEIQINSHDLVEFKKGSTNQIMAYQDPLDQTHKIIELPVNNNASIFTINLPNAISVAARCEEATFEPGAEGFTVEAHETINLKVTHNLGRYISHVSVYSVETNGLRLLEGTAAYVTGGILQPDANTLIIEGLATREKDIKIHLIFS